jgi:thiol-disulfide isomerase/thioredoxin
MDHLLPRSASTLLLLALAFPSLSLHSSSGRQEKSQASSTQETKPAQAKQPAPSKAPSESDELQRAIDESGNDRAALVRNLEAFLQKFPESQQRPQIYRALVEASLQLRDSARAANYAERIIALNPDDISMTVLSIQLLERNGDEAALRRAVNYAGRVLEFIERGSASQKSPKVSLEEWQAGQKRDKASLLLLRGRLFTKLHDNASAEKDFESSEAISPSAVAEEQLGEIAELKKDWAQAIKEYARAFLSADAASGVNRHEIRQKLGNVWRLAHGSDDGLGDYLLHAYDEVTQASAPPRPKKNAEAKEPYEFTLRRAPEGSPFPLAAQKGKILVVNFWATWCGPCRALEPHFEHVASQFLGRPDVMFLAADCDEDETLVAPFLEEQKPRTLVVFADGLDRLLGVHSFPTLVVLDRAGKIAYRSDGFDPDSVEKELADAIRRTLAAANPRSSMD